MAWQRYALMSQQQRDDLFYDAFLNKGDRRQEFLQYFNEIKKEANKRLRNLENRGYDYGRNYNETMNFLLTRIGNNRFVSAKQLGYNYAEIYNQMNVGAKFLSNKSSIAKEMHRREQYRIKKLKEFGAVPEGFTTRQNRDFLKFLGNETMSATIDAYGKSDTVVELAYAVYKRRGSVGLSILERSLEEFLDQERITFNEAMERAGVKIEDYYSKRPSS